MKTYKGKGFSKRLGKDLMKFAELNDRNLTIINQDILKDANDNVPQITSNLKLSSLKNNNPSKIIYAVPYAEKVYYKTAKNGKTKWVEKSFNSNVKAYEEKIMDLLLKQ